MQEKTILTKICKHCNSKFEITNKDLEFYEKISPIFAGKKYEIPSPTLCPDCRQQRRLSFRNERNLYKRKCDATGKEIISIYSPEKPFKVYNQDYWWSDKWNPLDYGIDFDFNKSFYEQFNMLMTKVPKMSLSNTGNENSNYCHNTSNLKDCYLCFGTSFCNNTQYSTISLGLENCMDVSFSVNSKESYNIVDCANLSNSYKCVKCIDSSFLYNCYDCLGSHNCLFCIGLKNKIYCILNEQYSEEEYNLKVKEIFESKINIIEMEDCYKGLYTKYKNIYSYIVNCENCSGSVIFNCINSFNCYDSIGLENSKNIDNSGGAKNSYDVYALNSGSNLCYEGLEIEGYNICFSCNCLSNNNYLYYSYQCLNNCLNLFGCVGLKNKSYCIFNKQYTKEEYEELVPKIIEHMQKTGEWGDFFPSSLSPFGYNETVANEYFPLTKAQALEKGFNWSGYEQPFPKVEKIIPANKLPDNIKDIPDDILNRAVECEITKKPFRIIKQELEFYRKHNLPIPKRHPDQRHLDRMSLRNPRKLYDRKCDKCGIKIISTYSPDREEIVYCEKCYNKEVY